MSALTITDLFRMLSHEQGERERLERQVRDLQRKVARLQRKAGVSDSAAAGGWLPRPIETRKSRQVG